MRVGPIEEAVRVCASGDVPTGEKRGFDVDGRPVCVVRVDDELHAFDDVCPHRGAALSEGKLVGTTLTCAKHTWEFDVRDGALLRMRAPVCLTMREVHEDDGSIYVAASA